MTDLENYYHALSEVYLVAYQDLQKPLYLATVGKGVVADMLSELGKHESTFGKTERTKATSDRLELFMKVIETFENTAMLNKQLQLRLKANMGEIAFLRDQVKEYEEKIKNMTELLQEGL